MMIDLTARNEPPYTGIGMLAAIWVPAYGGPFHIKLPLKEKTQTHSAFGSIVQVRVYQQRVSHEPYGSHGGMILS
jgi:hypothetical protein